MTQGRFDSTHNCRPLVGGTTPWDTRNHWTVKHHPVGPTTNHKSDGEWGQDLRERESCPFHDLRAGGQFQYEYWGAGVGGKVCDPRVLNKRSDARGMVHGLDSGPGPKGVGGGGVPQDTDPGAPQVPLTRKCQTAPWTKPDPLKRGLFGTYEYIPDPADGNPAGRLKGGPGGSSGQGTRGTATGPDGPADGSTGPGSKRSHSLPPFAAGSKAVPYLARPHPHGDEPFNDKINYGRIGHLAAGVAKPIADSRRDYTPCPPTDLVKKKFNHKPFLSAKAPGATFGGPIEYVPSPYDVGRPEKSIHHIFTWWTHSKWSMPTHAPWSTGKKTAEPIRGAALDLSQGAAPMLLNSTVASPHKQTIGSEAALLQRPEPVRFR
jgi:hypothetical protein